MTRERMEVILVYAHIAGISAKYEGIFKDPAYAYRARAERRRAVTELFRLCGLEGR